MYICAKLIIMHRITLSNGIVAIGGPKGIGKTRFTLSLAQQVSSQKNVLYFSTHNYKEQLELILKQDFKSDLSNLYIETNLEYLYSSDFIRLYRFVEDNQFNVIVFDDLTLIKHYISNQKLFIEFLNFMCEKLQCTVILILDISSILDDNMNDTYEIICSLPANLSMFNLVYGSSFMQACKEVYAIHRPNFYDISESTNFEIHPLKNSECNHTPIIFDCLDFGIKKYSKL